MANNRIFIECVGCDYEKPGFFYLGKHFCDGYYNTHKDWDAFNEWMDAHKHCGIGYDHFQIAYECKPDGIELHQPGSLPDYSTIKITP